MRRGFIIGFVATTSLVPVALIEADLRADGKHLRPLQMTTQLDGAEVAISVDRGIVPVGDKVTVMLVGTADKATPLDLDVTVMRETDFWGSRVSGQPVTIDRERVHLDAAPGGGTPASMRFALKGEKVNRSRIESFRIFVAKHDADTADAAAVTVVGWRGDTLDLAARVKGKIAPGEPFDVAVRVKNTTGHALPEPHVELGFGMWNLDSAVDDQPDFTIERVTPERDSVWKDDHEVRSFGSGKARTVVFHVTPTKPDMTRATFVASAFILPEGIGSINDGAVDVVSFPLPASR